MRRFANLPGILETPSGMDGWEREIAAIRAR
jgi:endonuclease IV